MKNDEILLLSIYLKQMLLTVKCYCEIWK